MCLVNALHAGESPCRSSVANGHALFSDKTGERFFHISGWWWGVILGYVISLSTMVVGGRYVSMFLMAAGYSGA